MTVHDRAPRAAARLPAPALLLAALAGHLDSVESAVVLFCGDGREVIALAGACTSARLLAFDSSERAIRLARAHIVAARLADRVVCACVDPLLALQGPHDLIVLRQPFSRGRDAEGALRAARRALAASGLCAVIERASLAPRLAALALRAELVPTAQARNPRGADAVWLLARSP